MPLEAATGIIGDATMNLAERLDLATGMDACGNLVCATAVTVCAVAQ